MQINGEYNAYYLFGNMMYRYIAESYVIFAHCLLYYVCLKNKKKNKKLEKDVSANMMTTIEQCIFLHK